MQAFPPQKPRFFVRMISQMDALPHRVTSVSKSSSITLTFPQDSVNVIWTAASTANLAGVYLVNVGAGGTLLSINDIKAAPGVSYTRSGLNMTIANNDTANGMRICCLNFLGGYPTEA